MNRKAVSGVILILVLTGMLTLAFNIRLGTSEPRTIGIVLVVVDPDHLNNYGEQVFYDRLLSKGYTSVTISHSNISTYDFTPYYAAVVSWDPYHITEPRNYTNLLNSGIGIVLMSADVDKLGLGTGAGATSYGTAVNITDNTHYITSPFPTGSLDVYSVLGYRNYMQRAPETTLLANIPEGDIIVVRENIVYFGLMWADHLTSNGWMLFDRSVEFAYSLGRTIYIRPNGDIDPPTAPILRDGDLYTLTDDIFSDADGIVIERNNMTFDGAGYALQGVGIEDGIHLTQRNNVTIQSTNIRDFGYGIHLYLSSNITITGNNFTDNYDGIHLYSSSDNMIAGNNIANGSNIGIWLFSSSRCYVSDNNANDNRVGILLEQSFNCFANGNDVENSDIGISLYASSECSVLGNNVNNNIVGIESYYFPDNTIYHNNFINNTQQVESGDSINNWDDDYPSGGNYWSDYNGTDLYLGPNQNITGSDGVADEPYVIDAENQDNYPLMQPYVSGNLTVSVYTDKSLYHVGDTMYLGLNITNPDSVKYLCFAVWCELPDSSIYPVMHQHSVVLPIGLEYSNPSFKVFALPILPSGTYTWHVALLERATHTIVVHDTAEWEFT